MSYIKEHAHHLAFIIALLALAALLSWWSIFIRDSIRMQEELRVENLKLKLQSLAHSLGSEEAVFPRAGVFPGDDRFEIGLCVVPGWERAVSLVPLWPEMCMRIRPEALAAIEDEYRSLNFMRVGESGLLLLIIFVTSIFLYRFIRLERRTTREIRKFWERSAHEIKTPITGIKAFLQNLKSRASTLEELAPYVDMALAQVERQEQLAENLLSGYQVGSKRLKALPGDVDLAAFLIEYFEKSALNLADDNFFLDFQKDEAVSVRADAYGLRVILDNLVDNAMKYCSSGFALKVGLKKEKNRAVVVIADNGPGFSAWHGQNIFSAYRRLESELPEGRHGTGIGLYISRQLARGMGGDLTAESEGAGKGARFLLTLELAKP